MNESEVNDNLVDKNRITINEIEKKEVQKKERCENRKQYMKEYREKNMEKWYDEKTCVACGGKYKSSNLSNHNRSNKHKMAIIIKQNRTLLKIKDLIDNMEGIK